MLAEITADDLNDITFPLPDNDFIDASSELQLFHALTPKPCWFLAPDTWSISHDVDPAIAGRASRAVMKDYIATLQSWFERWISTGANPFIHHQLYKIKFPACVQIAYATLMCYIHRTPANTEVVLQIVESRSDDLIREDQIENTDEGTDLHGQLARLHALMVYQIIGLHDGDIRARHIAEGHIATQDHWAHKLLQDADKVLSNAQTASNQLIGIVPNSASSSQQQWHLWIFSESIRRTWLVAVSISRIFSALQQRWATCPGGLMYTNRRGLWEASTATEWERRCAQGDVAFLQRFHCAGLFGELRPADVDEFGLTMMDMTFDADLVEKWKSGVYV